MNASLASADEIRIRVAPLRCKGPQMARLGPPATFAFAPLLAE
jgi:hypothetical protein